MHSGLISTCALVALTLPPLAARAQTAPRPCVRCAVLPSPAELDELEHSGHHKKVAGAVLIAGGSALIVAGTALMIAGAWNDGWAGCYQGEYVHYRYGYGYGAAYGHDCGNHALEFAGGATAIIGFGALGAGIPVYIVGGHEVARARWLRFQLTGRPQ